VFEKKDATRKTNVFLRMLYLKNEAKSSKKESALFNIIHPNKPGYKIWIKAIQRVLICSRDPKDSKPVKQ